MTTTTAADLRTLALFEGCATEDLERVAGAMTGVRHVAEGDVVCAAGEAADRWWVVVDGLADVTVTGLYVGTVGPGEAIGELALLDGKLRGATVVAATDMVLDEIAGDDFIDALLASPSLSLALLRQLAARLRSANERPPRPATTPSVATGVATRAAPVEEASLDPGVEGYLADPGAHLGALREAAPVHWSDLLGAYVVLRHDDVHRLLRDRSMTGSITTGRPVYAASGEPQPRMGRTDKMMIRKDGADHTRLRRLVSKVFTPRAIESWRQTSEGIVERSLADVAEMGAGGAPVDLVANYALPLPANVISRMLGVPTADIPTLRAWSRLLVTNLEPLNPPEHQEKLQGVARDFFGYLEALVDDKRAHPGDDILTSLIEAEDAGDVLDDGEIQAQVLLLYVAGHETTVNLIGNGVTHLFRFPGQLDRLRAEPDLDANAVEEILRFESPAQFTRRLTHGPVEVDDTTIPPESLVMLALTSANHDPRKWGGTADTIDVARPGANEHVSFGGGPHFCLGAALARLEGQIALPRLVRRFPRMQPAYDEPDWGPRMMLRGVETLPVTLA